MVCHLDRVESVVLDLELLSNVLFQLILHHRMALPGSEIWLVEQFTKV